VRQVIERTISRFEPRLKNVTVQIEAPGQNARDLRFRITAMLVLEPITEPVIFDTYFDVGRGEYKIQR
jgi:type VI secretion system protein ImpF